MAQLNKKELSERDICTKYITPALQSAGWDIQVQVREEVFFTKGRIIVRGKMHTRGEAKRADYILYLKENIPIAVIEAKDNNHALGAGMQQAVAYAQTLDVPFAFSSNGDGFLFHDLTVAKGTVETELGLEGFTSPDELWRRYRKFKGISDANELVVTEDYYTEGGRKEPRYYQLTAINRTIEAIARGEKRVLLVMATGTGKRSSLSRSFGVCGNQERKNEFSSLRTEISWWTRRERTISSRSARR
jgi:type I restriction enzyme, R subunit